MNKQLAILFCSATLLVSAALAAEGGATEADATSMVKKGVAFIKASGKEKGYAEISNTAGQFKDRDLYLVVYGLDGTVHAHGANGKMIGKNLIELKDVDGKAFVKERVEMGKAKA
ncbi:MAG TPA: cache domain-containing protein, partial [Ideonella sp.]|nr:cache domain-containing protein [Ideonella sp.]